MKCVMHSLGKYNLYCHASETQLQEYLGSKYESFLESPTDKWPVRMAAKCTGLQKIDECDDTNQEIGLPEDTKVWVMNGAVQFDVYGTMVHPDDSPFIWLGPYWRGRRGTENIASQAYMSRVLPSNQTVDALTDVITALHTSYQKNFPSSLLVLGAQLLNLHYEMLTKLVGGVPVAVAYGDVQCGKTRAMETALGTRETHFIKKCSDMKFLSVTTQTTLGLVLDDPTDASMISEKIMLLFDGKKIEQQGEAIVPRTTFMTTVNMECFHKLVSHHRLVIA